jgi:hypothetical protein
MVSTCHQKMLFLSVALFTALIAAAMAALWPGLILRNSSSKIQPIHLTSSSSHSSPTPLSQPDFVWYTDPDSGFAIQYPRGWNVLALEQNPGIEFDNGPVPTAICQVLVPPSDLLPRSQRVAALNWVNFELDSLSSSFHDVQYLVTGQSTVIIDGEPWRTRSVTIRTASGQVDIQVYAGVHKGQPYIINLLTVMTQGINASFLYHRYFQHILASFHFNRPNPAGGSDIR